MSFKAVEFNAVAFIADAFTAGELTKAIVVLLFYLEKNESRVNAALHVQRDLSIG